MKCSLLTRSHLSVRVCALVLIFALGTLATGCGEAEDDGEDTPFLNAGGKADAAGIAEGSAEAAAVLRLVNEATLEALDVEVGLSSRAAQGIIAYRERAAEQEPASSGFDTLAALDAVPYVGPATLSKLLVYARAHGYLRVTSWRDRAPAGAFSLDVAVAGSLLTKRCSSASYFATNPGCQSTTTGPGSVPLTLSRDPAGRLIVSHTSGVTTSAGAINEAGTFALGSSHESCGERSCGKTSFQLSGHVTDDGTLMVDSYRSFSVGGNQALGFSSTIRELAGPASSVLPW